MGGWRITPRLSWKDNEETESLSEKVVVPQGVKNDPGGGPSLIATRSLCKVWLGSFRPLVDEVGYIQLDAREVILVARKASHDTECGQARSIPVGLASLAMP